MPRVKRGVITHKRHKRIIDDASGYWGARHHLFKTAKEAVMKAMDDAFRGRKEKKRTFRAMWIARINAGCRQNGITYNRFIDGLNKANITVNRKSLAELAIQDPKAFTQLVDKARAALG
ncbi:MAG TPA: 50S ribosomal protein L20 [Armatimonadota bacterium]|nr:50S ribosomal protein L20 [Armatimonadota bacterium]